MSHVHAFACICNLLFLSFDIKNVWCFSNYLSLPLSLSYINCIMAPKCKSTMSLNPLHFKAASSSCPSNPTPSHVRFRDKKAKSDFSKNFSRCGIHSECQVILLDFFDTNLPIVIYSRGWKSLCGILVTCPSMIILEFYSNMHGFDTSIPHFITHV